MLSTRPWLRCLALERRDRKNHCAFASSLGIPSAGQRRRISSVVQSPLCDVRLSVRKQFQNRRCQLFDSNGARNPTLAIARTFSSKENGSVSVAETEAEAVPAKTIASSEIQIETRARSGPPLQLRLANMALHAHSSVIATAGTTVILSTVSCGNDDEVDDELANESFLTVEYRQRTAAVGLIPGNRMRSDSYSSRLSNDEILASRCIDRALRPLLPERDPQTGKAVHFHIHTSVQAVDVWGTGASSSILSSSSGHPVATALNAASAALMEHLIEPVAATVLAVLSDGSIVQDPGPEQRNSVKQQNKDDAVYCVGELLYAGTRTHAVMMEWTSIHKSLPESQWPALLNVAAQSLHPILDSMEELRVQKQKRQEDKSESTTGTGNRSQRSFSVNDPEWSTAHLRKSLGLSPLPEDEGKADMTPDEMIPQSMDDRLNHRQELLSKLVKYCRDQLGRDPPNRLFGFRDEVNKDMETSPIYVHQDPTEILTKSHRGRLETIMHQEIARLVNEYLQRHAWLEGTSTDNENSDTIQDTYVPTILNNQVDQKWLHQKSVYRILRHALWETSARYGTRADGRRGGHLGQGWKTVRPVSLTVPALPDSVHGSALFARGDTQVLCTVTLGAPRDGQPPTNPYQPMHNPRQVLDGNDETDALPVGSLRFLRTQEALESDLNSRNSLADKERTGDSGNLAEVKRAFLQYDFPAYSTGEVPKKGGIDRRSVGHGALAERAILPLLPDPHDFPYSIRITSEVTDSNGSSSMASVCGATLALLDAGVPMKEPVAGVSVGLAVNHDHDTTNDGLDSEKYCLLMDITGTEDHVSSFMVLEPD